MKSINLKGKKFGNLTVIKFFSTTNNRRRWWCKCNCGKELDILQASLTKGATISCGCRRKHLGQKNSNWNGCGELTGSQWALIRNNAKNRNISIEIDIRYAWDKFESQNRLCALSGLPISFSISYNRNLKFSEMEETTASLDRIDNSKGYTKENIQWVHKDVNMMKRILSEQRFIEMCNIISNYQKK